MQSWKSLFCWLAMGRSRGCWWDGQHCILVYHLSKVRQTSHELLHSFKLELRPWADRSSCSAEDYSAPPSASDRLPHRHSPHQPPSSAQPPHTFHGAHRGRSRKQAFAGAARLGVAGVAMAAQGDDGPLPKGDSSLLPFFAHHV